MGLAIGTKFARTQILCHTFDGVTWMFDGHGLGKDLMDLRDMFDDLLLSLML